MKKKGPKPKPLKENVINRRFASNFRDRMAQKTFSELNKETGIAISTLNKMANGFTLPKTEEDWIKLTQALKTTVGFLLAGEDKKDNLDQEKRQSYRRKEDRERETIIKNLNPQTNYQLKISIDTNTLKDILSKITA